MLKHLEMFVSEGYLFCTAVPELLVFIHSRMFPEFPILLWLQGHVYCSQKSKRKCADNQGNIQISKSKAFQESENLLGFFQKLNY